MYIFSYGYYKVKVALYLIISLFYSSLNLWIVMILIISPEEATEADVIHSFVVNNNYILWHIFTENENRYIKSWLELMIL